MGTILVFLGGYYLLSGQAARDAAKWIDKKIEIKSNFVAIY